ncbi:PD-(D/E)XK nuclease family protein [Ruficoccus amylovorans]|uniref:PD-(D/E)XK nuclease family protein n=1 Tax=Ruficoccus amylovorans TaxID=1804625 RepID=A0A842HED7_9BACT|nr:PD-(D/E)XK nuclease family protein [Ruficoccus amylovorans]MBC2594609.1 PD-(D/E)XK nuclease family protein [Ruficoccus amylovorans]
MIQPLEQPHGNGQRPSTNGLLDHLSASTVKLYLTCPLKFWFKKVLCLPEPSSPSLHLGKAVHAALQCFHRARWRGEAHDWPTVQQAFTDAFDDPTEATVYPNVDTRQANRDKGMKLVEAYLDSAHGKMTELPLGVEVLLEEDLPVLPSPVLGYIDLVRPGNVPVDYKTCASTPDVALEAFQHEVQLTLYQLLIESATNEAVSGRELVFLVKTKTPKVIVHRLPAATEREKQRVLDIALAAMDGIYHERFHPQPGMHCAWCSFRGECAKWTGGER